MNEAVFKAAFQNGVERKDWKVQAKFRSSTNYLNRKLKL